MKEYYFFANVGRWKDIKREKINRNIKNQENKINDPVSFCLYKRIEERGFPEKVFLFSSEDTKTFAQLIKEKWEIIRDFEIVTIDPFDVKDIREKISKKISLCLKNDKEVVFNITGGTKLMVISTILELFNYKVDNKKIDIYFVLGKRNGNELLDFNEMKEITLDIEKIDQIYKNKIIIGKKLFLNGNFKEAEIYFDEGQNISILEESVESDFLRQLSIAYRFMDDFDYNSALGTLKNIQKNKTYSKLEAFNKIQKIIEDQIKILENIKANKNSDETYEFIIFHFFFNSKRNKSNPNKSLIMLYRSFELLLAYKLKKLYNFDIKKPDFGVFHENMEKIQKNYKDVSQFFGTIKEGFVSDITKTKIYMKELLSILLAMNDKNIQDFYSENKNEIKNLLEYRNKNKYIHWFLDDVDIKENFLENFIKKYEILLKKEFGQKFYHLEKITKLNEIII